MKIATSLCLCSAIALFYSFIGATLAITAAMLYIRDIHGPRLAFPFKRGRYKLKTRCEPSASHLDELKVHDGLSHEDAIELAKVHGTAVVPNVLVKETAQEFRDYVMKANHELNHANQVFVLEKEHRFNLMPDINQPVVQEMLKQVGEHPRLRPIIDGIMGEGASLVNMSVLTAEYGAKDQDIHPDTSTSFVSHPERFVPEYTLVIALQDTTEEMGATHLCPGTHFCRSVKLERGEDEDGDLALACKVRATVNQGDAFLYVSDLYHRGVAHTDPNAPDRAFLFLIFAASRNGPEDKRRLPFGEVRALDWKIWGHTIDEFATIKEKPWKWWQSFGLFNKKTNGIRPWNFIDNFLTIFENDGSSLEAIANDFDREMFDKLAGFVVVVATFILIGPVYFLILPMLLIGCFFSFSRTPAVAASTEPLDQNKKQSISKTVPSKVNKRRQ